MANTTNFGWETPDDTDLVKDGALAMRTLGNAIDTSLVDLKGGTTGQVLSKNTNTDMDFTWVTPNDADAIQNSIVDAKGDLIAASANDTPARLAVGNNGETLVADSSATTGLRWQADWNTGKNKIINGDFGIWQRSTSATVNADGSYFAPDRYASTYTAGGATVTWSRQSFTAGTAPVAGYEGTFFSRLSATSGGASTEMGSNQKIEDVRTLAGQTATFSLWAKADSARTATIQIFQIFGSGGSATVTALNTTQALTTSWTRYSFTVSIPSISGKTIGTNSSLGVYVYYGTGQASGSPQLDTWGWQLEAGSVATPFTTATGTLAGELAACQRYYWRNTTGTTYGVVGQGMSYAATNTYVILTYPVTMRTTPTSVDYGNLRVTDLVNYGLAVTTITLSSTESDSYMAKVQADHASGATAYRPGYLAANNNTAAYIGLSAEL